MEFFESTTNIVFLTFIILTLITAIVFRKRGKAKEFVSYAPTLLTTLGIFGTFFGIVLGLMEFNQNDIETSIPPLLAGLKTAFFTSLAGMLVLRFSEFDTKGNLIDQTIPVHRIKRRFHI